MHILKHSTAHLLAQAVMELYPDAKPTIGPAIDRGFYYDFAMEPIAESDLKTIQKKCMRLPEKISQLKVLNLTTMSLREHFSANPYKIEIIDDKIGEGTGSTIYKQGEWYDLCLGPHVQNTAKLMFCKLTSVSSAYWRGDQDREQLVRIYGIVEPTKEALKQTLHRMEEAKKARPPKPVKIYNYSILMRKLTGLDFVDSKGSNRSPRIAEFHRRAFNTSRLFAGFYPTHW